LSASDLAVNAEQGFAFGLSRYVAVPFSKNSE
jgi:hypothetical protein